jgi:hypothetical protein
MHASLLTSIHRWLREDGLAIDHVRNRRSTGIVGDWLGAPMFFSPFDAATNEWFVREAGF